MTKIAHRLLIATAGVFGAAGVAGAAYAAHGTANSMLAATAAGMLLVHAPALLALAILVRQDWRAVGFAGLGLGLGTALFSGDLFARILFGDRLFANAAPIGGTVMIAGWLIVALGALLPPKGR
ncbi:Uncharacterized membrane protein YgdD, TMEM256/DUF423 family [Fulvimarina manganoxydans]|uniref:Uncharacterized membrane protein YgdD, TMEM256/DUF423 family n=1 Tax=Fulvimarina manganoxydans TaxID=937218 RepID=A0A1W1YH31_9HYPH|nr:DUF423 domain-containing protein [Fulvimarina manganoxydans]SMC35446.1 Uncharacterized membrane protein YgdD, TMEM256/DUF423 family [Fulvimarina manganoxydans]